MSSDACPRSAGPGGTSWRQDRRFQRALLAQVAVAALCALGPGTVCAQAPVSDAAGESRPAAQGDRRYSEDVLAREHALASSLRSPSCPGHALVHCSSAQALAQRQVFRAFLKSGISEAELAADFERRWGDLSRFRPKSWLGWALPGLLLLAGVVRRPGI